MPASLTTANYFTSSVHYRQDTGGTDIIYQGNGVLAVHHHAAGPAACTLSSGSPSGANTLAFPETLATVLLLDMGVFGPSIAGNMGSISGISQTTVATTITLSTTLTSTVTAGSVYNFCPGAIGVPGSWNSATVVPDTYTYPSPNSDGTYGPQHALDDFTYAVQQAAVGGFGSSFNFWYKGKQVYGVVA